MSRLAGAAEGHGLPQVKGSWTLPVTQEEAKGQFARKENGAKGFKRKK